MKVTSQVTLTIPLTAEVEVVNGATVVYNVRCPAGYLGYMDTSLEAMGEHMKRAALKAVSADAEAYVRERPDAFNNVIPLGAAE